jgi:pimeloyl-ACP methyl ester carboxylesterase
MIATRLAALAPERVTTLTLISTTAGGTQSIPRSWRALKYALQLARAGSVEDRAKVDLKLHFCPATLDEPVRFGCVFCCWCFSTTHQLTTLLLQDKKYGRTRRELLHEEYVEGSKRGGIGQPRHGFMGQLRAIWMHRVTDREAAAIVRAQIPVLVLHGRHDILATPRFGEQLARRLAAPCVLLEGAHFLTRERGPEVNQLIAHVLAHGRRLHSQRHRYLDAPPPPKSPGQDSEAGSCTSPLDMARAPSPSPSPPVSRVSSSTYLLASSPL